MLEEHFGTPAWEEQPGKKTPSRIFSLTLTGPSSRNFSACEVTAASGMRDLRRMELGDHQRHQQDRDQAGQQHGRQVPTTG